jgi:8-amino-7-oxononanoate synthase
VIRDGRELWNFASNDYLGLARDPDLTEAFAEGLRRYGTGAGASRLVTGSQRPHQAFEEALAAAKQAAAALLFSSGFATAVGAIPAIVGKDDTILLDKLCHACLIDGARLSGATVRVFPHNDLARLNRLLCTTREKMPASSRLLVVTEAVFSMDGDCCPLAEIVALKERYGALLMVDEAHSFGVCGATGMGLAESLGLAPRIDFQMGTLSKAAGLAGGYLAASRPFIDLLINRARSFVYSTAPPPALAHAALISLETIRSPRGTALRSRLLENVRRFTGAVNQSPPLPSAWCSPIIPLVLGGNEAALAAAAALAEAGMLVPAIRFPTVPRSTARLRISLSAAHPPEAVDLLAQACVPYRNPVR